MTTPLSQSGKYQLVVLGAGGNADVKECTARLERALELSFSQLGVDFKKFLVCVSAANTLAIDRKMPTVGVFFGLKPFISLTASDAIKLKQLITDGTLIIPIVGDIDNFISLVAPQLANLNGISIADCGADFERISARILEGFGLLREKRRLFISYRRVETRSVASQLYEMLDSVGFDVFLDTHGVRPGEPFQDVLWHRLADTDVAVVLDSPGFLASRWPEEELARANTSNIQMLQILWPNQADAATTAFSTFYPLTQADFAGAKTLGDTARLCDPTVSAIVDAVEGLRARAIAARRSFLVREFIIEARQVGLTVRTTLDHALIVSRPDGKKVLVQPAIGVPDAERYEILVQLQERERGKDAIYAYSPVLLYDQSGIRSRWLQHLGWLNGNLTCAKSVSLVDAKDWLTDLKTG